MRADDRDNTDELFYLFIQFKHWLNKKELLPSFSKNSPNYYIIWLSEQTSPRAVFHPIFNIIHNLVGKGLFPYIRLSH